VVVVLLLELDDEVLDEDDDVDGKVVVVSAAVGAAVVTEVGDDVNEVLSEPGEPEEPEDPEPDDSNEHTSLTLVQQSPFKPQNASQKHASMVVPGCCTLPPQLSAHDNQGEKTSVTVSGRGVVSTLDPEELDEPDEPDVADPDDPEPDCTSGVAVLVVLKTTSMPPMSTRTKLFRTPGAPHGAV